MIRCNIVSRIGEQLARLRADDLVVENCGIAAAISQVWKNGVQSISETARPADSRRTR